MVDYCVICMYQRHVLPRHENIEDVEQVEYDRRGCRKYASIRSVFWFRIHSFQGLGFRVEGFTAHHGGPQYEYHYTSHTFHQG